jgi:hypothetical protein
MCGIWEKLLSYDKVRKTFVLTFKSSPVPNDSCRSTEGCRWEKCAVVTSNVTLGRTVCLSFIWLPLVASLQIWNFPKTSRCSPSVTCTIGIMSSIGPIGRPFAGILIFWYNRTYLYVLQYFDIIYIYYTLIFWYNILLLYFNILIQNPDSYLISAYTTPIFVTLRSQLS